MTSSLPPSVRVIRPVRRGFCGAGPGPCNNPDAVLYPVGWRSGCHLPGTPIRCACGNPLPSPTQRTGLCPCRTEVAA